LAQTITFPALATRFFDAAGTPVLATASSGLRVIYSTSTPQLCQILDLGASKFSIQPVYPLTGADNVECVLLANQAGNDKYLAATAVSQTLTFIKQATKVVYKTSSPTVTETGTFIHVNSQTTVGLLLGSMTPIAVTSLTPNVCTAGDYGVYNSDQGPRATVRAKANGVCSVKMDYPGNASQLASTATWTSTISGLTAPGVGANTPQSISFPAIPDRDYGYSWKLEATATSKLPVKYTSLTPSICQIIEKLAGGPSVQSSYPLVNAESSLCIVQASQSGDDRYAAAPAVQQSFKYRRAAMVITPYAVATSARNATRTPVSSRTYSAKSTYYFAASLLFASGENSGLLSIGNPLRASSTTPGVCTVASVVPLDTNGGIFQLATVNTLTSGTCNIVWNFDGSSDRAATSINMIFAVR
jgi:hypothetical protein